MDPYAITGKRILFAPLNWGLGHASRSAKLISHLKQSNSITLASDGIALAWLNKEFPDLSSIELPELKMRYSKYFGAAGGILFRIRHFIGSIKRDYKATKEILKENDFDLIISDNRYGVYSENITSILITHQLHFDLPFSSILEMLLQNYIEKFNEVWVPDTNQNSYSGNLSRNERLLKIPIKYIGILSRFTKREVIKKDVKFTLIASGPEPFRTQLVRYFEKNFSLLQDKCCIINGGETKFESVGDNVILLDLPNSNELENMIDRSEYIICRSGYSSIMDLIVKEQKAVLIPTPNQVEQKYLAELHSTNPLFESAINKGDLPRIMKKLL